jgi:pimeloyl-ACP methyl ester carboxylesterase
MSDTRPWITLVHGFSQDARVFDQQVQHLVPSHRVLTAELLGHGQRTRASTVYGIEQHADEVLRQLEERGIERTVLWGTHTGAAVGLWLAVHHRERIAALVLEAPVVPGLPMPAVELRLQRARSIAQSDGVHAALEDWFDRAEFFDAIRSDPIRRRAAEHRDIVLSFPGRPLLAPVSTSPPPSIVDRLGEIDCNVLIYTGAEDMPDFTDAARYVEGVLPHAVRITLPDLGGFPAWEAPGTVNDVVSAFLRSGIR